MIPLINNLSHDSSNPFIVALEGVDFSGKTTLAHRLQNELISQGYRIKLLHDPKGSKNAQIIWETILTLQEKGRAPTTEFFLFLAARNELIYQEASIKDVDIIIFDRFIFSTIAYQLTHQSQYWEHFLTTHRFFSRLMPDLCIYCHIDFEAFQARQKNRQKQESFDQMSQERFESIQQAYEQALPLQICPYVYVNNTQENKEVTMLIKTITDYVSSRSLRLPIA